MTQKHKKRLLFIIDSLNINLGGAEISTTSLISELSKKYYIDIISFDSKNINVLEKKNINLYILNRNKFISKIHRSYRSCINPFSIIAILKKITELKKSDLIIVGNIHDYASYSILPILKLRGFKIIHIIRDTFITNCSKVKYSNPHKYIPPLKRSIISEFVSLKIYFNPFRRYLSNLFVRCVDLNITISRIMMEYLRQYNINSIFIYNGVEISKNNKLKYLKEFRGGESTQYKILFPSRPSSLKGISSIYKLAKYSNTKNNKLIFIFTCSKSKFINLSKLRNENIPDNIIFLNWVNHKKLLNEMKNCDLVIYPSQYLEPFGRVPIEAMNEGIPVAVSNFGALPEIVINRENGLILDYEKTSETYEEIINLLKNKSFQESLIINGYKSIKENFSMEKVAKTYTENIDLIIK